MAQVIEFSLILMAVGKANGQVGEREVVLVTLVMVITIIVSSYMMQYNEKIFVWILPILRRINPPKAEKKDKTNKSFELALFGHDRVGRDFVNLFFEMKKGFFVVDYNPDIINNLRQVGRMI
jgi:hypothetical protein